VGSDLQSDGWWREGGDRRPIVGWEKDRLCVLRRSYDLRKGAWGGEIKLDRSVGNNATLE